MRASGGRISAGSFPTSTKRSTRDGFRIFTGSRSCAGSTAFTWSPAIVYGAAIYFIGGWDAFIWGFLVSTVLLYHGTFLINSLTHIWGSRRFATPDESRNNFLLAIVTLGEGWHNNHHHYMSSVRQGIRWWEIDITYYTLVALSWIGITRDLRPFAPPPADRNASVTG